MARRNTSRQLALKYGLVYDYAVPADAVRAFIDRFRENYAAVELIRVGDEGDGGYLLPDIFSDVRYCFSPGVSQIANFEKQLSERHGITCFMADASVSDTPVSDPNFAFLPKFLGSRTHGSFITLTDWMTDTVGDRTDGMVLQMDIEGAEYEVFAFEPAETLRRFSAIVVEFHDFQNLFDPNGLRLMTAVFEKLFQDFVICHAHPNNCSGKIVHKGIEIPRVFEISFLRRDLLEKFAATTPVSLPHPLDSTNVPSRPDVVLRDDWWRTQ